MLLIDGSRNSYYDDANHAMMFISSGAQVSTHPGEGAHWIFNGRADDRDFIFRNNSSNKLIIQGNGGLVIQNSGTNNGLTVDKMILGTEGLTLGSNANNNDAPLYFDGATTGSDGTVRRVDGDGNNIDGYLSNFRVGNGIISDDIFEITATDGGAIVAGGSTDKRIYKATPAIAIEGSTNAVGINTTSFSGVDNSGAQSETRYYHLNVQGDMNINGQFFQNNEEFVTSRWTESTNDSGANIYRDSKVGIGDVPAPAYRLHVKGSLQIEGSTFTNGQNQDVLWANGQAQWCDSYGIIKLQRTTINEDVTIPANVVASSIGDIVIATGKTVTISNGGEWYIMD
jgi:hypothetical protein